MSVYNGSSESEVSLVRVYLDGKEKQTVEKDKLVKWGGTFICSSKQIAIDSYIL